MGTATISFGPKLGLLNNAAIGQTYFNQLRPLLQALDQLIMGQVINATTVVPPASPNNGDAYLLSSTGSAAWSTFPVGSIAVWDTQVTQSGTNNLAPAWVNYVPKAGWTIWNVATAAYNVYNGSAWVAVGGGANFPTNTDITSMTGIPNTTIDNTGYTFNDGTNPATYVGNAATAPSGQAGPMGFYYGTGEYTDPTTEGLVLIGNGPWTGLDYSGIGVGVFSAEGSIVMGAGTIQASGVLESNFLEIINTAQIGYLKVGTTGPAVINSFASGQQIELAPISNSVNAVGIMIGSGSGTPTAGIGMLAFRSDYFVQTTVGAAGSASALPATPKGYLPVQAPDGSTVVIPYYAAS